MIDYALRRVLPADYKSLPTSTSARPLAGDIEGYLHGGLTGPIAAWLALSRVDELSPGDLIAWQISDDAGDTGHAMVVLAAPAQNPARAGEWLVRIADSTVNLHAADSRPRGTTGLGTGTIGLVVDDRGAPIAFYWQGGISKQATPTEIALGRPL